MARDSENNKYITVEQLQACLKMLPAGVRLYPNVACNIQLQIGEKYIGLIDVEREIIEIDGDTEKSKRESTAYHVEGDNALADPPHHDR